MFSSCLSRSDDNAACAILTDVGMTAKYGWMASNKEEIRTLMCGGADNCFVDATGFSTTDQVITIPLVLASGTFFLGLIFSSSQDNDNYPTACNYGNVGYWCD